MNKNIDELKKHKIGILAGGPSSERDISLKSGKAVLAALQGAHLDVIFLDVNEDDFSVAIDKAGIDLAFIALHGRFGEDGTVQKLLTNKNIPYTGSGPVSSHHIQLQYFFMQTFQCINIIITFYSQHH